MRVIITLLFIAVAFGQTTAPIVVGGLTSPTFTGIISMPAAVLGPNTIGAGAGQLPSAAASTGQLRRVTDALTAGSATGGGTAQSLLVSNGAAWVGIGGSGSGTNSAFNLTAVTHSATPLFDLSSGNGFIVTMQEDETATVSNQAAGQIVAFLICQDGSGNHAFAWPSNVKAGMTVDATASKCNAQSFISNGTNLYALSAGVVNQ